jgi:hypothetical protein
VQLAETSHGTTEGVGPLLKGLSQGVTNAKSTVTLLAKSNTRFMEEGIPLAGEIWFLPKTPSVSEFLDKSLHHAWHA